MGGQLLYELHVSWYVFLAIILEKCVSEIFSVHGRSQCLPYTLLARGCRNSPKVVSSLQVNLFLMWSGGCRMSPDISLPGHFTIPNNVVGEMQKGSVKIFGKQNMKETWDIHTCLKNLTFRHAILPFLLHSICPYFVVLTTGWTC